MTPKKKLFVAAAILATGFALAMLFAAPQAVRLSPIVSPDDAALANAAMLTQSLVGPIAPEATQLVPEMPLVEEQSPAAVAAGAAPSAELAQSPSAEPQMLARLVGIRPAVPPVADASPRGPMVALPQVTVQVSSARPVYAVVDYPQIVSAVGSREPEPPSQEAISQASFNSSIAAATDPYVVPPLSHAPTPNTDSQRSHVIVDGDSLPRLAERYLDDPERSAEIFQLNKGRLTDPELLPIGLELKIPPRALKHGSTTAWSSPAGRTTLDRGLVPVYDIPSQGTPPPRAQLMRPLPASWPEPSADN